MLGLFSTLEALYDLPFEVLLYHISLPDDVNEALCNNIGKLSKCIPIAICLENGDLLQADRLLASIGIDDIKKAAAKYQEAIMRETGVATSSLMP
jgi:Predicted signal transduction protein containing EAL and modified HD-GYP domains